jgi:uncharacterized protein YoxC
MSDDFVSSQFPDRRRTDGIAVRLDMLHSDVDGIHDALKELTASVNRLAVVEERLGNTNQALERAFIALEKLGKRMTALEEMAASAKNTSQWVDRAIYGALGLLGMYAANHIGMLK